ncbi:MAG: FAD-binding oxidoreductase [Pseudomonadota bacterium]
MRTDARVAVIGGGIVGASVLYCLTRQGWTDSVLLERRELTSGSTWHAAGNTTYFGPYPTMTRLFTGSLATYLQAEADTGQSIGFHQTGSIRLAATPRERALFDHYAGNYAALGIPYHVRTPAEVAALHPLIDTTAVLGAAHTPTDGHVDPAATTHVLARGATAVGAEVCRQTPVTALRREAGAWVVDTARGAVRAQHVVVAASFWARELLAPLGVNLPLYATQHHEMITDAIPALASRSHEVPAWRDSYVSCSVRQEGDGVLVGIYESEPVFWALEGIPADFAEDLFEPELDRLTPHLERLIERMPTFASVGIKTVLNGPMCWTPDGLPMLGPVTGQPGLWLAAGFNVGIGTGGGSGAFLAHWMAHNEPPFALPAVHADRFDAGLSQAEALERIRAVYARGYELPDAI